MILWAIKSGRTILPFTIRLTRKKCIADYMNDSYWGLGTWEDHERGGTKCVKVSVVELMP